MRYPENISLAPQNGPKGCITAVMTNVHRYLFDSDLSQLDLDRQLGRGVDDDYSSGEMALWYLDNGLSVAKIEPADPTNFDGFIRGEQSFDEFIEKVAAVEFDGYLGAAKMIYGSKERLEWYEKIRAEDRVTAPKWNMYKTQGRYVYEDRVSDYNDILRAVKLGSAAVGFMGDGSTGVIHTVMAFDDSENASDEISVFYPTEGPGSIICSQRNAQSTENVLIQPEYGLYIISDTENAKSR